jgi:mannan endo-1,4-beta-mannosidase
MKLAIAVTLLVAATAGCSAAPQAIRLHATPGPPRAHQYLGVSSPDGMPGVTRFAGLTGTHPDLVSSYTGWYEDFDAAGAKAVSDYGALPLIFLDSGSVPVSRIADGPDTWLTGYAEAVAAYRHPVAISFDSEFNGPWWPWSFQHETPAAFTDAWRRIVTIFRHAGAANVTWVWTVAASSPATTRLGPWWPGSGYVNWAGVNAYYSRPGLSFNGVFGRTFSDVAKVTGKPVLITETGANPASGRPGAITCLFAGVESMPRLLGFVWFDYAKYAGHNWRIDGDPAALAAFRAAAKGYR